MLTLPETVTAHMDVGLGSSRSGNGVNNYELVSHMGTQHLTNRQILSSEFTATCYTVHFYTNT